MTLPFLKTEFVNRLKTVLVVVAVSCRVIGQSASVEIVPLRVTDNSSLGFVMLPPTSLGITFTNLVSSQTRSLYTLIPTGIAAGDVDGDGLCDLYFCSSDGNNVLYRNLGN